VLDAGCFDALRLDGCRVLYTGLLQETQPVSGSGALPPAVYFILLR
jgi:hypothetical protein